MKQNSYNKVQMRIFKQVIWVIGFVAVANIISNLFTGYPMTANIKWVVVIIVTYIVDELGLRSKDQEKVMFYFIGTLIYTIFPMGWYNSGLVSNNSLAYLFLFVIGVTILFERGRRIFLLVSLSGLFLLFMSVEQFYPELMPVHSQVLLFRDRMIQIPLIVFATSTILIQFTNALKVEYNALEVVSTVKGSEDALDTITGLGSRMYIVEAMASLVAKEQVFTSLIVSIDDFKAINGDLGYNEGNQVLGAFSKVLTQVMPPDAYISRYSGGEFMVVLTIEQVQMITLMDDLIDVFNNNLTLGGSGMTLSGGYGIYNYSVNIGDHIRSVELVMNNARKVMNRSQIIMDKGEINERKSM